MNAKKAKELRRLARIMAEKAANNTPDEVSNDPQVLDKHGSVVNTIASVRGVYQYLKNPRQFHKRYES